MRSLALLTCLAVGLSAGAASGAERPTVASHPPWVSHAVRLIRADFIGSPVPANVTWTLDFVKRSVTVTFREPATCGPSLCFGGPAPIPGHKYVRKPVTGRRVVFTWYTHGPKIRSVSIQKS